MGNQPLQLTPEEMSLLEKDQKFLVTPATIPIKEYISTTTLAALQEGELNDVDCSGLYHDISRVLKTYINKKIHTSITKAEHLAVENPREDKDHIIVTADKVVDLVVIHKSNMPMQPIVSGCDTATHNTAKFITKILQK